MSKTELFVRKQTGGIYSLAQEYSTTGNIFWVDSGATSGGANSTNYGRSPASPFLTIDYAIGKCTDNNGDIIYVMPGHAETISGALSLAIDVAGVKIIGMGAGYSIPKLTFSAAASTIAITAANCHLENLWLYASFTGAVAAGITASALADGLVLKNLIFEESASSTVFTLGISIVAAAHHVTIDGIQHYGVVGGAATSAIKIVGPSNFSVIKNCKIYGDFSGNVISIITAASTYLTIRDNYVCNVDATGIPIAVYTGTTGMMAYNNCFSAGSNVVPLADAMAYNQNKTTNVLGAQGFLLPVVDS